MRRSGKSSELSPAQRETIRISERQKGLTEAELGQTCLVKPCPSCGGAWMEYVVGTDGAMMRCPVCGYTER